MFNVSPSIPCCPLRLNYKKRWTEVACRCWGRPRSRGPCPGRASRGSPAGTSRRSARARRSRYAGTCLTESETFDINNFQRGSDLYQAIVSAQSGDTNGIETRRCFVADGHLLSISAPPSGPSITCAGIQCSTARPPQPPNLNIPASEPQYTINTE